MIKSITLENFKNFNLVEKFDFASGLNIFIGTEGSGKSRLINLLNSILTSFTLENKSKDELTKFFKNTKIMSFAKENEVATITINIDDKLSKIEFSRTEVLNYQNLSKVDNIFIPARNIIDIMPNKIEDLETLANLINLDEPSKKLIKLLSLTTQSHSSANLPSLKKFIENYENIKFKNISILKPSISCKEINIQHKSEGVQRMLVLAHLWSTGAINDNTTLLMDNPETGLSPSLINQLTTIFKETITTSIQSFITTHSYLMCTNISLMAEYDKFAEDKVSFFCIYKNDDNISCVEKSGLFDGLENNPILDEYMMHYAEQEKLFIHDDND